MLLLLAGIWVVLEQMESIQYPDRERVLSGGPPQGRGRGVEQISPRRLSSLVHWRKERRGQIFFSLVCEEFSHHRLPATRSRGEKRQNCGEGVSKSGRTSG